MLTSAALPLSLKQAYYTYALCLDEKIRVAFSRRTLAPISESCAPLKQPH